MGTEININVNILTWAIDRAGFDLQDFVNRVPYVQKWLDKEKKPTIKQLEEFSKKVYLPFGYLLLPEPPKEHLPIPFYRTNFVKAKKVNVNVYDTILLLQKRQDWLKNYLLENNFGELPFVGKFSLNDSINTIVSDIRNTLRIKLNWASGFKTWQESLNHLSLQIENAGIITTFNGVVENKNKRKIPVSECRGFVLVDTIAPFMFVNNADSKAAQMFTLAHELAHIWIGQSAGFDFRKLQPANDPLEIFCDKIAAEFLIPEKTFLEFWDQNPTINNVARFFKVSKIVVARRALDTKKISLKQFIEFYNNYIHRENIIKKHQSSGGDFYDTTKKRLSITFASHINNAVKSGRLLYRDAYKLTSLKGDTFNKFFTKHF